MTVKRLLNEIDSEEIAEWWAYDQRWPLPDHWQQTARICRTVMCASGNYKPHSIPDEKAFIPSVVKPEQSQAEMLSELMKLAKP